MAEVAFRGFDAGLQERDISREGLECAICLQLFCEPLKLGCGHVFCRACLEADLRRERRCPLCRREICADFDPRIAVVDPYLEKVLRRTCLAEYMQRLDEIAAWTARLVHLRIGNRFQVICSRPRCAYRWTVFVELEKQPGDNRTRSSSVGATGRRLEDLADHVTFVVPPQCRVLRYGINRVIDDEDAVLLPRSLEVKCAPYEVMATSWGMSTIHIDITWKAWLRQPPLHLEHQLDFSGSDSHDKGWLYGVDLGEALNPPAEQPKRQSIAAASAPEVTGVLPEPETTTRSRTMAPRLIRRLSMSAALRSSWRARVSKLRRPGRGRGEESR